VAWGRGYISSTAANGICKDAAVQSSGMQPAKLVFNIMVEISNGIGHRSQA